MSFKLLVLCTILLSLHDAQSANTIIKITDDDFLKMTATKNYIIILFTKENCKICETMETELLSAHKELMHTLDATIAKIYNSKLVHVYSPSKEPALVFFRHGVPLLYLGEVNEELILHHFIENKEPTVKELKDENFEHLTQATTGSTTGDWFIMFYRKTCAASREMTASWEAVGAILRTKMNVARIDIETPGYYTGKRFDISNTPSFLLLHNGYMYTYKPDILDINSLLSFARNFKQMPSQKIPMPSSAMDCFLDSLTEIFEGADWFLETGFLGLVLGLIGAIFVKCIDGKENGEELEDEEKEDEDEEHEEGRQEEGDDEEQDEDVETDSEKEN